MQFHENLMKTDGCWYYRLSWLDDRADENSKLPVRWKQWVSLLSK